MACWNVCRPTLLIPYGLKSILECVCRAIKIEEPQHIQQFIVAYCKDLLMHRDHAPSHDLHQVIHLYQKMRERGQVQMKSWRDSPDQAMLPCGEPAEMCQDLLPTESTSLVSCRLADDALDISQRIDVQPSLAQPKSPTSPADPPLARVQSAVFQRVPSTSDFPEVQETVLIESAMAPSADVIVVHSEKLPDAIVFQLDSRPTSASSVRFSVTSTPSVTDMDGTEECALEMDSGGMVVFERVPSKEDCLPPQSAVDIESGELQNSEIVDKPLIPTAQEENSGDMEKHAETLKMAASQELFKIMGVSSKRSLVKVFSAHLMKTEDSVEKVDDQSEQSDRDTSSRISPKTSITVIECPPEPAKNYITTSDIEGPTEQAADSSAKPGSHPMSSNDLSDESEDKQKSLMAETVGRADSADKFKSMVVQLSEECVAEVVGVLEGNRESSESLSNDEEITERDTPPRISLERVAESGVTDVDGDMRQAGVSQDVSPDPFCLAETPQTVMSEAEIVSPLSTVETADIHTLENVTSVGSPVQMNLSEMADADHLNVVKEMREFSAFDNSELPPFRQHQPEETSDSVDEHTSLTSTADEDDLNASNTACIPCETVSPLCTVQRDEETEAQEPSVEDALNSNTACIPCETVSPLCTVQRDEETEVQEPSVEDALNPATAVELVLLAESSGSDNTECPERAENMLQENVESATPICCGTYTTERLVSEPVEENMDSTTVVTSSCEQNMSKITETAPVPQTLQTDASPILSPVTCPEPEGPQTALLELELVSPLPIGLAREEATALQPSVDGASCTSSVVNDKTNSSDSEGFLLKSGLLESSETETFDRIEIEGIVVPKDLEAVSTGRSGDVTEESPCQPAEDSVDHRVSFPTVSSQATVNDNTGTDDLSLTTGTSDSVVDILEPSPLKQVPSEERGLAADAPAQIFTTTTTEENPDVVEATDSTNITLAAVPSQEGDMSRSRGTTDRGTSPGIPPRTSSVLGCVHASIQVSCVSVDETARDMQGDQNPASGSQLTAPPCTGDETTAPPTKSIQTEIVQAEEQQQHTEDAVTGRGTPVDTVFKTSVDQMWTLYHLPHSSDEGTLCTQVLFHPPFNGSAYIRAFGPGHVLMAEKSPQPSSHNLQQAPGWPRESTVQAADHPQHQKRAQDVAPSAKAATAADSVRPSASFPDTDTVEISLPNFLLCTDDRMKQETALLGAPGGASSAVRVRRDDAAGILSLSIPSASLSGSQWGSGQAQFLQLITEEGRTVYSPAVVRIATHHADQSK
ncbi:putative GPI-anchored protein pfl2 [Alosa sapidissima]|uniref:putative GPI-anchored protein pfl2 n=1 Tax=Alosa sapidissima TaxID=34773 RepID=UPI001C08E5BB|nr:putative GPI-anchored protein pfl2 [Alosa sapidissima]